MNKIDKVICLGKEFSSEDERRAYFRNELRLKLPELKKIEGFPIGEDEDIINLSDPPYYTACPNPWLNDFITQWEKEMENIPERKKDFHVNEPYASDVSEGKNNPIYNAHSYHTKVPHPAIMRYILHYTQPGDIIFDGFAGTGMTGVAAKECSGRYDDLKYRLEKELGKDVVWGNRNAICSDLSPIASFISFNYNSNIDASKLNEEINGITAQLEKDYQWMFTTKHHNGEKGKINYVVWSDVYSCYCGNELNFLDLAFDQKSGAIREQITCPICKLNSPKNQLERIWETKFDEILDETVRVSKVHPTLINYTYKGKRFTKKPDSFDHEVNSKIEDFKIRHFVPVERMPDGDEARRNDKIGMTHVHQFYHKRNLIVLADFFSRLSLHAKWSATNFLSRNLLKCNRFVVNKHNPKGRINGPMSGTLYVPSESVEQSIFELIKDKAIGINLKNQGNLNQISSAHDLRNIKSGTIDYIFTDPPFGANIMYSELNFISESWIKLKTNIRSEAIENKTQNKSTLEYQEIMTDCFKEYFRILKPSKWMTVEFSNTSAAVWNSIQTGLQKAGFVISNISGLDKKHGGLRAMHYALAVKQDLVISCYKPSSDFDSKFMSNDTEIGAWNFLTEHLNHLPIHLKKGNSTTSIIERSPKILFDRLITFYLMKGFPIPIDAKDFQEGLKQRFVERDGMYFTAEQAAEYDEKKAKSPNFVQLSLIVTNESDAIEWLKDRLRKQTQKYQDIMPEFRIATQSLRKGDTLPELQDILNENFIQESDGHWRTPDPNESKDREALRTKVLLKEFNGYVTAIGQPKAKKLKEVRVEALRAGFKNCWEQKDFKTIVNLGDMIPQNILLEDEQLLMYYDIAKDRV
jgi:DNA modification methylase